MRVNVCRSRAFEQMMRGVVTRFASLRSAGRALCAQAGPIAGKEPATSISVEIENFVAVVRFNNVERRNALNDEVAASFKQAIESLKDRAQQREVGAVVITGHPDGKAFCAGAELEWLKDKREKATGSNSRNMMYAFYESFLVLRTLPVPVIAAVNGAAVGAGLGIAMACDMRIVAKDTKLALTFMKLGLSPGMGTTSLLPALVGLENATRLLLTSEFISGEDAKRMGLASEAVERDDVMPQAIQLAETLSKNAFEPSRFVLLSMRSTKFNGFKISLGRESLQQCMDYRSQYFTEGITAAIEKRTPDFRSVANYKPKSAAKKAPPNSQDV